MTSGMARAKTSSNPTIALILNHQKIVTVYDSFWGGGKKTTSLKITKKKHSSKTFLDISDQIFLSNMCSREYRVQCCQIPQFRKF